MRREIRIICIVVLMLILINNFSYATDIEYNDKILIEEKINEYFDIQFKSLKEKDEIILESLDNIIDKNNENGKKILDYINGKTLFLIKSYNIDGTSIESYDYKIDYRQFRLCDDNMRAKVELDIVEHIKYNFLNDFSVNKTYHEILLTKYGDDWLITEDNFENEFLKEYGVDTDFGDLIDTLEIRYETYTENFKKLQVENTEIISFEEDKITIESIPGDEFDSFTSSRRNDAVSYARKYTEDSGDYSTDTYNLGQFKSYGNNDCQNFVSQCIWYGFGGRDSADKDKPMTIDWWANETGEVGADGEYDWNWTSTNYFRNWILNNKSQNDYGIQGISYTVPTYMKIGDYVYDPGHVMLITKITDDDDDGYTDWDEIYISAHTKNREDYNLKALYYGLSVPPSDFEFIKIYGFKWNLEMYN